MTINFNNFDRDKISMQRLMFNPIDLHRDSDICVRFRADSFFTSFGDTVGFYSENGTDGATYIKWLEAKLANDNWSCVHLWDGNEIVGQIELGRFK